MTTIGLIGSGNIGSTVARLAVDAGYDVVLSNRRGPDTLRDLVEQLGPRARAIPVNAIKGGFGHTMGAAATLEAIMCLLASRHGVIPPTLGFEEGDPECDLDYVPRQPRPARPVVSLSTSAGFGGCNAALVLEGVTP